MAKGKSEAKGIHRLAVRDLLKLPADKPVNDGGSLWLGAARNGVRRATHHTRQGDMPLDCHVLVTGYETCRDTLAEARARNDAILAEKAKGLDPKAEREKRQRAKAEAERQAQRDVLAAVKDFTGVQPWGDAARKAYRRRFEIHLPSLVPLAAASVTLDDVETALGRVPDLRMREQVRRELYRVFRREISKGHRPAALGNPCDRGTLQDRLGRYRHVTSHQPALPLHQLPATCLALEAKDKATASAALFTVLTACRPIETVRMQWAEVDFEHAIWRLPPSKTKNHQEHVIPLSEWALALLRSMHHDGVKPTDRVWVRRRRPMSVESLCRMLATVLGYEGMSLHGSARANFRTWCGEVGVADELAEKALNHTPPALYSTYQRSPLIEPRRPVMQRWATYLRTGKMEAAHVVPLHAPEMPMRAITA